MTWWDKEDLYGPNTAVTKTKCSECRHVYVYAQDSHYPEIRSHYCTIRCQDVYSDDWCPEFMGRE